MTDNQDYLILLTPTKMYNKCKTDTLTELIFPSPSLIISKPQKENITNLINIPSPRLKRKETIDFNINSPRKIKLKEKI